MQGSPGIPGAPATEAGAAASEGVTLVEARRALFGPLPASPFVTVADGYARRGKFAEAAQVLHAVLAKSPRDAEAWLALANVLTEHAEGRLTPAAVYAFDRARRLAPGGPAPGLFFGVALIRSGEFAQARQLWAGMLADAPADAPWRGAMQERLDRLDVLIAQAGGQ
jgi:cytochrome c-type biogenesis protein CcmH